MKKKVIPNSLVSFKKYAHMNLKVKSNLHVFLKQTQRPDVTLFSISKKNSYKLHDPCENFFIGYIFDQIKIL